MTKDYSLNGDAARRALESEAANPAWFRPEVDPAEIRVLMAKSDMRLRCVIRSFGWALCWSLQA